MNVESKPVVVVLAPDVFGRAFTDSSCAELLRLWRDGRLRPALNRALLTRYLALLRGLGLPERLLRHWAWWLSARDRVEFLPGDPQPELPLTALCVSLATAVQAEWIVDGGGSGSISEASPDAARREEGCWISARALLQRLQPQAG